MSENNQQPEDLTEAAKIAMLSDVLVKEFGADACDVVERQIEAHENDLDRAKWIAIWEILCSPRARRAKYG